MLYSLLLLIHVQVQYDLVITRNTCVSLCLLNCFNLFLKYELVRLVWCVCVCVCFGSMCLTFFLLRDVFESLKCCLDLWLSNMFDYIHVCVFLFFEKLVLSNLDSFSIPLNSWSIYQALWSSFYRILDSFSTDSRSIEKPSVCSIDAR